MKKFQYESYQQYINKQVEHHAHTLDWTQNKSYDEHIQNIKKIFPNAKKILCVGARDVSEVYAFKIAGYDSLGIDLFSTNTHIIRPMDMHNMATQFQEKSFDVVFSSHSLEHTFNPEHVLQSMKKVAAMGCYLVLPNHWVPSDRDPAVLDFMEKIENDPVVAKNVYASGEIESEFVKLIDSKNVKLLHYEFRQCANVKDHEHLIGLGWEVQDIHH